MWDCWTRPQPEPEAGQGAPTEEDLLSGTCPQDPSAQGLEQLQTGGVNVQPDEDSRATGPSSSPAEQSDDPPRIRADGLQHQASSHVETVRVVFITVRFDGSTVGLVTDEDHRTVETSWAGVNRTTSRSTWAKLQNWRWMSAKTSIFCPDTICKLQICDVNESSLQN